LKKRFAQTGVVLPMPHQMDTSSQRRVLRNYGAVYGYLPGEVVEEGDETV
jgi:hypothetical protein